MEEKNIQEQIRHLDQKLDRLLEFVEQQNRKREEFDDLVTDVSIVAKDAFKNSVVMLDKSQVELDSCGLSCLVIKILQNLDTFHEMLDMMESARDFMKDVTPILHQVGLDAINKMNELDQKGYFESIPQLLKNLSDPALLAALNKVTKAVAETKIESDKEILSMWQILKQLRSKEVRKTLTYSLKIINEITK